MPYKIEWFKKGVCVKAIGVYSIEDSLKSNGELYGDPRYDIISYQIGDFLDATVTLKLEDVKIVGAMELSASVWNHHMKIAHVTKDKAFIKVIKAFEKTVAQTGWEFGIFETMEEAGKWVNE